MTAPSNRLPDWVLERLAHGDLPEAQRAEAHRRLDSEPGGRARLEALAASDQALASELPAWSRVEARAARQRATRRWQLTLAMAPLAAGLLVVVLLQLRGSGDPVIDGPEVTRIKGGSRLVLVRQTAAGTEPLEEGGLARAGEVVQLGYLAAPKQYGVIVSLDGRGVVTLHFPDEAAGSTELAARAELPHGYRLDEAPGFERFVLVSADRPVDVEAVLEAARKLARQGQAQTAPLPLPAAFSQFSFVLRKASP